MKFGSALAIVALAALVPSMPITAAKDDKLARCNGRQKRPANPYGTVLPTVPDRAVPAAALLPSGGSVPRGTPPQAAASQPMTNLFPPEGGTPAPQGAPTPQGVTVPAIGALTPGAGPTAALQTSFASC